MDYETVEALIRAARAIAVVTGLLVVFDSMGILVGPYERPAHRPKWSAVAWILVGGAPSLVGIWLIKDQVGLVGTESPPRQQMLIFLMWAGLACGFTLRALARAERPWMVAASGVGMSIAAVSYALGGA